MVNRCNLSIKRFHATDGEEEDLRKYFQEAWEFINEAIASDSKVLIHCKEGRSRSASIAISYLVKHRNYSLKMALECMSKLLPEMNINDGFKRQLIQLELDVTGRYTAEQWEPKRSKSRFFPLLTSIENSSTICSSSSFSNTSTNSESFSLENTETSILIAEEKETKVEDDEKSDIKLEESDIKLEEAIAAENLIFLHDISHSKLEENVNGSDSNSLDDSLRENFPIYQQQDVK
jgi:hypothetical protein